MIPTSPFSPVKGNSADALAQVSVRLGHWLREQALPFWLAHGIEPESGAHHEQMLADGRPDTQANIRVRVQARQIFAYSFAYCRGWAGPEALTAVRRMRHFLDNRAAGAAGGYSHLLNPRFDVIDRRQDLYDHAFHLLACAWEYKAFGDPAHLEAARALVGFLDRRFGADYGGWIEGDYAYTYRRQNPHMHLFEAFQALYEVTGDGHWLARAGEIFTLFETCFYCPQRGLLFEFFERDWRLAPGEAGRVVEPGHMLEWVWLLERYGRWADRPVGHYTERLYREALAIGQTSSGLILDQVDADAPQTQGPKRSWPMTELIKASIARARTGDADAQGRVIKAVNALFDCYLCGAKPGTYVDRRDENDAVMVDVAPASTLYHLVIAAAELADYAAEVALTEGG
ncbi:AGE family epimerase/isomerase [Marinimicrobium alkaliphilum]|uniref:AGE family epimerase/isomerase n=1 Tax=Marinimicrobium alkaliphilum TaxID=2202654 RepID=UPI000DB9380C|nr:AGE family epimerase/isomerase [Marinimicrobium alkaliphilum]